MHFEEPKPRALFPLNSKGCLPDSITFNIVIQSFLPEHKIRKAIELVEIMCKRDLAPNESPCDGAPESLPDFL